jgi:hypothetical protein
MPYNKSLQTDTSSRSLDVHMNERLSQHIVLVEALLFLLPLSLLSFWYAHR